MGDSETVYDVIIVGGGPGGISAAVEAEEAGLEYLLLEKAVLGNTVLTRYPKGKDVEMDYHGVVAEYIGKMDFGTGIMTQEDFLPELLAYAGGLNYQEDEGVEEIAHANDGTFEVRTWRDEPYLAKNVIIAIGQFGRPNTLPLWDNEKNGFPSRFKSYISFSLDDPGKYDGLDILVIGGGDTAIETALALKDNNTVDISYRKPGFLLGKRLSQKNYDNIHEAIDAEELEVLFGTNLISADRGKKDGSNCLDVVLEEPDIEWHLQYDKLFLCLGGTTPVGFLEQAGITVDGRKPNIDVDTFESLDVPGLYVIGDLSGIGEKSIVTALKQGVLAVEDLKAKLE